MNDPVQCATKGEAERIKDSRRRRRNMIRAFVRAKCYAAFWRVLWFLRLGRPYSKMMCRLRLYPQFPEGRCMWCGVVHCGPWVRKGFYYEARKMIETGGGYIQWECTRRLSIVAFHLIRWIHGQEALNEMGTR